MHEIVRILVEGASNAPTSVTPPSSDGGVRIAIITAISVVVAAAITAFATTLNKHHGAEDNDDHDYIAELVRRAEVAEARINSLEHRNDSLVDRVDELERYCWRAGIDPNTGSSVVVGNSGPKGGSHGSPQG